jgi:hypothetical protein
MSMSKVELFVSKAKQQSSTWEVIQNLIDAIDALSHEVKRLDSEIQRTRRDVRRQSQR